MSSATTIDTSPPAAHRYLIIGGATKAATTSLYAYLADHPAVCAASLKETRFFLDPSYPVPSRYRLEDGLEKYEEFYEHCRSSADSVRMEATPNYLYSWGSPQRINECLPHAQMIFILREPVSRLVSWYRFALQLGEIPSSLSLEGFVQAQVRDLESPGYQPDHLRAMEQGRYVKYLQPYMETLGRDRVYVIYYEDLIQFPYQVLKRLCDHAGLDASFYEDYSFKVFNRTENMRYAQLHKIYVKGRFAIRSRIHNHVGMRRFLRELRLMVEPIYLQMNTRSKADVGVTSELRARLEEFYRPYSESLGSLLHRQVPW